MNSHLSFSEPAPCELSDFRQSARRRSEIERESKQTLKNTCQE